MTMPSRKLGANGPVVSALGMGCMRLSNAPNREANSVATIHAALDAGIGLLNSGDFYGMGESELVIGKAIKGRRDKVFISVKYGGKLDPGGRLIGFDAGYAATLSSLAFSLRRLGTDYIDLYQPARIFPQVPLEETMEALAEAVRRGWIRHIGLSEVSPEIIARASAIHPVTAVEAEFSLAAREAEQTIFPAARASGAGLVAYAVLGAGLLGGRSAAITENVGTPRFEAENLATNLALVRRFENIAGDIGCSAAQLAIAWVLARGEDIVPLIAPNTPDDLAELIGALDVRLGEAELTAIDAACPPGSFAGTYHPAAVREQSIPQDGIKVSAGGTG